MTFLKWQFGIFLLALATWQPSASQTPEEGFYNFLHQSMHNYHDWAIENGFEPLRVASSLNFTEHRGRIRFTCEMRNHLIHGLSKVFEFLEIRSNLSDHYFVMEYHTHPNIFVEGEYKVEESVNASIPIKGSGYFNNTNSNTKAGIHFGIVNFTIVDDYIDLNGAYIDGFEIYWSPTQSLELQLDGLDADGYEEIVTHYINVNYDGRTKWLTDANMANYWKYFEKLFKETPLSEIIRTTKPPTTTPENTEIIRNLNIET